MDLEREVRWLRRYVILSSMAFGAFALAAFVRQSPTRFGVIDVERINIVEPNGHYRMILSNAPRSSGPIYKGKPFGYPGGSRPGIIFFNDEGTENGGLTFGGTDSSGQVRASTHMSFDQFNQDQILNFDYREENGRRLTGISVADRAPVNIYDLVMARDSIMKIADSTERTAALRALTGPREGVPFFAERLFLGRTRSRASAVVLSDPAGRPRLRLQVDSLGVARIEFLDESGAVVRRFPD